jgi:periplasmic divalent cation tolerance protein
MTGIVTVYSVFGGAEEAERIGRQVVEERRAACVNILGPCTSIYRWRGRIESSEEIAAIFKTNAGQARLLIERIGELHSYDVPAAVVWPIEDVLEDYRAWVLANSGR